MEAGLGGAARSAAIFSPPSITLPPSSSTLTVAAAPAGSGDPASLAAGGPARAADTAEASAPQLAGPAAAPTLKAEDDSSLHGDGVTSLAAPPPAFAESQHRRLLQRVADSQTLDIQPQPASQSPEPMMDRPLFELLGRMHHGR